MFRCMSRAPAVVRASGPLALLLALILAGCAAQVSTNLSITTTSLPNGQVGSAYSAQLAATGGTSPYSWSIASGALPAGLSLNATTGAITGMPAAADGTSITFQVTDSGNPAHTSSAVLSLTIAVAAFTPLSITTASLPNGQVGVAYSATLTATGGTTPYMWSLTSGTLPAGLSLNAATGALTGTPAAAASGTSLTFQATDSGDPAQIRSIILSLTIAAAAGPPAALKITTTSLPNGRVGAAYSATLTATGGTPPYGWTLTSGTLPAGLTFNGTTGVISGTPTATATATALTFQVSDSGNPVQTQGTTLALTISPAGVISVSVSPARAGLAIGQTLTVVATTNDTAGVTWSISPSGGSFNPTSSASGANVTFTAPSSAGIYTVTATSVTNRSESASLTVGVTDLAGVYTYHDDLARNGANTHEFALTPSNVNTSTFGRLFSCTVDGAVYAQPLWAAQLTVNGAKHNVVFVATAHDSLFAFDADASPCATLWQASLIDTSHGGTGGEGTVPSGPTGFKVGSGGGDITPEVGVIGTPVIDPATNTLYVVSKSMNPAGTTFYQRLHAIDPTTGDEKTGSPVTIAASFPGTGAGGTTVPFSPQLQNQRAGLAFVNGTVYIAWAAHEDNGRFYGWMIGYTYNGSAFTQASVLNVTPNETDGGGGIWMSGGAPAADSNGNLYVITGNGIFDANSSTAPNNDHGDSFLQLSSSLGVLTYFAPSDEETDYTEDEDFGAGGSALVLNLSSGPLQHVVVGGGKDGHLYLLNGDSMGGFGDANARQELMLGSGIFATGAFWNNTLYIGAAGPALSAYSFNTSTDLLGTTATSSSSATFAWPGTTPSVSASGTSSNGIVWALNTHLYCTSQSSGCGPAVLYAFDATNLATELWDSSMVAADAAGYAVKFTVPTVANGKVYVGTRGNNTGGVYGSTTISGQLNVYGLKPN
jgi:Putative Ig domain